jgi:hypothetical protein
VIVLTFSYLGYTLNSNAFIAKYGTEYKFEVAPIDPYDAFRGKYVVINIIGEFPEEVGLTTATFDRYYIDEKYAQKAEEMVSNGQEKAYVTISVLGKKGVVTGLWVDGKTIEDYINEN